MRYVTDQITDEASYWNVPTEYVTGAAGRLANAEELLKKTEGVDASAAARTDRNALFAEYLYYFRKIIKNFLEGQVRNGTMSLTDFNKMGFYLEGQMQGGNAKHSIPTKVPTTKISQKERDKIKVIFENSEEVDAKEGHGPAWPDGVAGGVIRFRRVDEAETAWRYEYCPKIHNFIEMPEDWRGKEILIEGAYYAHVDDPRNLLHWNETQLFLLHNSIVDREILHAQELAAQAKEIEELKAQLAAKNN
jgi:hypothetical protein